MHLGRLRKADGLAGQAFHARSYGPMRALDGLCVALAWTGLVGGEVTRGGTPTIGIRAGQPAGLQQRFAPHKDRICAVPTDGGQDRAGVVIAGIPAPARVAFVPDKRPPRISLCLRCPSALEVPGHVGGVQEAQHSGVYRLPYSCLLRECTEHGGGTQRP